MEVAKKLINDYGLKPIEASKKMDVTAAAITQYLKGVRGMGAQNTIFNEDCIIDGINVLIKELIKTPRDYSKVQSNLCALCKEIRQRGFICDECKRNSPYLENIDCHFCME